MLEGKILQLPGFFTLYKAECKSDQDATVYVKHFNSLSMNIHWFAVRKVDAYILIFLEISTVYSFERGIEKFEEWLNN